MERVLEYVGSFGLAGAISYVLLVSLHPPAWAVLVVPVIFLVTLGLHEVLQIVCNTWIVGKRENNQEYSAEWDLRAEHKPSVRATRRHFPDDESWKSLARYAEEYAYAKSTVASAQYSVTISGWFISLTAFSSLIASIGWRAVGLMILSTVGLAILLRPPGLKVSLRLPAMLIVCGAISAACLLTLNQSGGVFDLSVVLQVASPDPIRVLLGLGVISPVLFLAILATSSLLRLASEGATDAVEAAFGRAFAIDSLVEALDCVYMELAWPSKANRESVVRHLGLAAYHIRWNLRNDQKRTGLIDHGSRNSEVDAYEGVARVLQECRRDARTPTADTYEVLQTRLRSILAILESQKDGELLGLDVDKSDEQLPDVNASTKISRPRVLVHLTRTLVVALTPGLAVAGALVAGFPLSEEVGSFATLFATLWAAGTILIRLDSAGFRDSLEAVRSMRSAVLGDKGSAAEGGTSDLG